jgi:hypothetical protein
MTPEKIKELRLVGNVSRSVSHLTNSLQLAVDEIERLREALEKIAAGNVHDNCTACDPQSCDCHEVAARAALNQKGDGK